MDKIERVIMELLLECDKLTEDEILEEKTLWEEEIKRTGDYPKVRNFIEEVAKVALARKHKKSA